MFYYFLLLGFILIFFTSSNLKSQTVLPLNHYYIQQIEQNHDKNNYYHTAIKPYLKSEFDKYINVDSVLLKEKYNKAKKYGYLKRKLFYESAIIVDTVDFYLAIDPVFNLLGAINLARNNFLYTNTRGFQAKGNIGNKLFFITDFYENQSFFPEYVSEYVSTNKIVPGQGLIKLFKDDGYDYAYANGLISYSPFGYLNIQFGHGKNFIGNGYRSLLLSDNAFNYPYLKITTTTSWLQYTNLYTSFIDINLNQIYEGGFKKKYGSFYFLNLSLGWLEVGLFEAVIWKTDSSFQKQGYNVRYLNPVIFYHTVQNSLNSPDNSLIGLNLKITPFDKYHFYGQIVVDDFDFKRIKEGSGHILNKTGFQAGLKLFDLLQINNFYLQLEYNSVRPYVYAHEAPLQNYAHYQQALAHPLGANFNEFVSIINYRWNNFLFQFKYNYAVYGADSSGTHWGKDIFKSDLAAQNGFPSKTNALIYGDGFGNKTTQGLNTTVQFFNPEIAYILNPNTNMQLAAGLIKRKLNSETGNNDLLLFYFAFKTSLSNFYFDF